MLGLLCILIHLAGSLVAFDTTIENYTIPVSGKCILTCYVAEVGSFKVSQSNNFIVYVYAIRSVDSTNLQLHLSKMN
jgi:hypothetical protein